nr:hypothetical protein [uncultured Kingella sp.]
MPECRTGSLKIQIRFIGRHANLQKPSEARSIGIRQAFQAA